MRLFRHRTPFRRSFGDTSGDTLHLYPVPRFATLCKTLIPCKSLICRTLCGQNAPTCKPLQLWKKLTQNPPRATSWGFDSPSRHQDKRYASDFFTGFVALLLQYVEQFLQPQSPLRYIPAPAYHIQRGIIPREETPGLPKRVAHGPSDAVLQTEA